MLEKFVVTILELYWNQRLGHKKTKLNICQHIVTSSRPLQKRSFHVVERTRTSSKCQKMKNARAKRAKIMVFVVKYANLWVFCCRRRRRCLYSLLSVFLARSNGVVEERRVNASERLFQCNALYSGLVKKFFANYPPTRVCEFD